MKKPAQRSQTFSRALAAAALAWNLAPLTASSQVPTQISYQGRVQMNNTNFGGTGQFKFAFVQGAGPTLLWKNDGSAGNTEPASAVSLPVANGLVMTTLGDPAIPNMTGLPSTVFGNPDVRLRVWFNGGTGFEQLTPDQRIVSVGYALMAANVPDGAITSAKLAPGAVGVTSLADNAVGSAQLADDLDLGSPSALGRLDIYRTAANTPALSLVGSSSTLSTYGSDGLEQIRLHGTSYGEVLLYDKTNNTRTVRLSAGDEGLGLFSLFGPGPGGSLLLSSRDGTNQVQLVAGTSGGTMILHQRDGQTGVFADGDANGSGLVNLRNTNGSIRLNLYGQSPSGGGGEVSVNDDSGDEVAELRGTTIGGMLTLKDETGRSTAFLGSSSVGGYEYLYNSSGNVTVYLDGDSSGGGRATIANSAGSARVALDGLSTGSGGEISVYDATGTETVEILGAESVGSGGQILMRNAAGGTTVQLDSDASGVSCGYLALYRSNGVANIILDAAAGTLRGQVIEITGGSDFSEKFDINGEQLEPGMIVSIDARNPGQLTPASAPYDKKVAGIVSGAGGIKPGMLMGQQGTTADGRHPVALTGRVYCWVDADANGPIEPGDMLTTSATPGHGMKVTESTRAIGAVVGKAMTSLAKGRGLVLVLVNLQ